jgi:hypothetical protein
MLEIQVTVLRSKRIKYDALIKIQNNHNFQKMSIIPNTKHMELVTKTGMSTINLMIPVI